MHWRLSARPHPEHLTVRKVGCFMSLRSKCAYLELLGYGNEALCSQTLNNYNAKKNGAAKLRVCCQSPITGANFALKGYKLGTPQALFFKEPFQEEMTETGPVQ